MRRYVTTALVDLVAVVSFVAIGRSSHHHAETVRGFVSTFWPFGAGLCASWLITARRRPWLIGSGAAVCVTTVAIGMVLRVIAGQGTAVAFILVALFYNGAVMTAGRALVTRFGSHPHPVAVGAE